jgi:hypothetical protein
VAGRGRATGDEEQHVQQSFAYRELPTVSVSFVMSAVKAFKGIEWRSSSRLDSVRMLREFFWNSPRSCR